MSQNSEINKLLTEFFELERNNPIDKITKVTEEWVENYNKHMNFFVEHLSTMKNNPNVNAVPFKLKMLNLSNSEFEQMYRMKRTTVQQLQNELNYSQNNIFDMNLLICLWVLGSIKSFAEISKLLEMSLKGVNEICTYLYESILNLSQKYIRWPQDPELLEIEEGFLDEFKFPGVVGVIGNIHTAFNNDKLNPNSEKYYNENTKNYTIVLQAVCDNKHLFRNVHIGYPGSYSTENIFKSSKIYKTLTDSNNIIAKTKKHLLGGTAFPYLSTLLTPYVSGKNNSLTDREFKFNLLHGSVMTSFEKTFRMVENRFPRIKNLDSSSPKFVTLIVSTICALHNFCNAKNDVFNCDT